MSNPVTPTETSTEKLISVKNEEKPSPTDIVPAPNLLSTIAKPSGIKPPTHSRIGRPCLDRGAPKTGPPPQKHDLNMRRQSDEYSRSHLPDQGTILTTDTDSFIIGQRIWVGGIRPGHIAYIGETHFAPGEWAGIVLDDPNGKNDGCVAGKRYFQCEAKRGIFSRLTRLTREPLGAASSNSDIFMSMSTSTSPSRLGSASPTQSVKSFIGKTPSKCNMVVGDRVIVSSGLGSRPGILKYIGETKFAPGNWCGVQLDEPTGKNDGTVGDIKYFDCPPQYGIFVPLAKVTLSPSSRKTRLSRGGSTESLTSIGTMDSIASTATSRLRSSVQRLSTSAKSTAIQKNTFSLQDVLREKQNHIEQLLLERDLDKQDADNQTHLFQKNISQLKEKVATLEKLLEDEKRKAEDLQFSIDEATYCEVPGYKQDAKTEVLQLENEIKTQSSAINDAEIIKHKEEYEKLQKQINKLNNDMTYKENQLLKSKGELQNRIEEISALTRKFQDSENDFEIKLSCLGVSEQCLRKEINCLTANVEELKTEHTIAAESAKAELQSIQTREHILQENLLILKNELGSRESEISKINLELNSAVAAKEVAEKQVEVVLGAEKNHCISITQKDEEIDLLKAAVTDLKKINQNLVNAQEVLQEEIRTYLQSINELKNTVEEKTNSAHKLSEYIANVDKINNDYKKSTSEKDIQIKHFETTTGQLQIKNVELSTKLEELQMLNVTLTESVIKSKDQEVNQLSENLSELSHQLTQISAAKLELEHEILVSNKKLKEQEHLVNEQHSQFNIIDSTNNNLKTELDIMKSNITSKDEALTKLNDEIINFGTLIQSKDTELETIKGQFVIKDEHINILEQQIVNFTSEIYNFDQKQVDATATITKLNNKCTISEEFNIVNKSTIEELSNEISALKMQINVFTKENENYQNNLNETLKVLEASKADNESNIKEALACKQNTGLLQIELSNNDVEHEKHQKEFSDLLGKLQTTEQQNVHGNLEVEHGDISRKIHILEQKCEQITQEKSSLEQNLEVLQSSTSDAMSDVLRLSEELQIKQKSFDKMMDKNSFIQLDLEKKLHEATQQLAAKTTHWEQIQDELNILTTQKIDRENELNFELSKIKESSKAEKDALIKKIDTLEISSKEDKQKLIHEINEKISESEKLRNQMNESIGKLEEHVGQLNKDIAISKNALHSKENEFNNKEIEMNKIETKLREELQLSHQNQENLKISFEESKNIVHTEIQEIKDQLNEKSTIALNFQQQNEELNTKLYQFENDNKSLSEQLMNSEKECESLKSSFADEKSEYETKLTEITLKFKFTEDEQVDLVDRNQSFEMQLHLLEEQLFNLEKEKTDQLKSLQSTQEEIEINRFKSIELQNQFEINLRTVNDDCSDKEALIQLLHSEVAQLKATVDQHKNEVSNFEQLLITNRDKFEAYKSESNAVKIDYLSKIDASLNDINEKNKAIKYLEDKVNQLTSSVNLSDDLKNELHYKSEEIKKKEINIAELTSVIDILKQDIYDREGNIKQILEKREFESQKSLDDTLQKTEEVKSYQQKLAQLEKFVQEQTENLSTAVNEKTLTLCENQTLRNEISTLNQLMQQQQWKLSSKREELQNKANVIALKDNFTQYEIAKKDEIDTLKQKLYDFEIDTSIIGQAESLKRFDNLEKKESDLLKSRENQLIIENKQLADKLLSMKAATLQSKPAIPYADDETGAQISFLNSIIADMQRKNESLMQRIQTLEIQPADFINNGLFDIPTRRLPTPRLFCDICDEFDAHETEDCPLQSSDSPTINTIHLQQNVGDTKERKLPPPRKYCESCEAFGHDTEECKNDDTY